MEKHEYKVVIGSITTTITAVNHKMAVMKAIEEHDPQNLGYCCRALKVGDDEMKEVFVKSEYILKEMGMTVLEADSKK